MLNGADFIGGGNKTSVASSFMRLKHWDDRDVSSDDVAALVRKKGGEIREATVQAYQEAMSRMRGSGGTTC